ncbi:response regulator [Candidatus Reidiella endopervernicosa]|uniref:Response regulator n=1 Tax=Candidatus Reidiella endopervernicosa TaxID=2738883 RepID=A0A6N0HS76_9GAMM|nr:response regulator [Candidatus Reidiella endopervernicosa]QKQ25121.1 response regulator [Candidatus Reidiella endopervernicosa]
MTKVRVLVVDDAAFMRDIVKKGMRSTYPAFQLDEAAHGKQAQTMIGKSDYDLILCDWEMPEMNGAELLQWIRETPEHAHLPFIMITSRGDKENVVEAIKLKVSNYIVKPFTNEKLINIATDVMSKAMKLSAKQLQEIGGARPDKIQSGSVAILTGGRSEVGGSRAPCRWRKTSPVPGQEV